MVITDASRSTHPRDLGPLHMNRAIDPFEQRGDALDRVAHHRPADMIRVVVRGQHSADDHAVGGHGVDHLVDGVGRVNQEALAGGAIADRIDEVDHLLGERIAGSEVATRQQLAEVEPIVGVVCHQSYATQR